jgi:hypothetical protein
MKKQHPRLLKTVAVSTDYIPNNFYLIYLAFKKQRVANSYYSALYKTSPSPQ